MKTDIDLNHAVIAYIDTAAGPVASISTSLTIKDYWQDWQARWSLSRDRFCIPVGLYAIGHPDENAPVLVTANYKLTFDKLRMELTGMNLWILVVNSKGINVWCAAAKGTFNALEIVKRIQQTSLSKIINHRCLILPQLAAAGVSSQTVRKASGFKVIYGPIRAADLPAFIEKGNQASAEMRRVRFDFRDRIVLTPVELLTAIKVIPIIFSLFFLLNLISKPADGMLQILTMASFNSLPYLIAIFIGTVVVPALLPVLPFRSFALKGACAGILWSGLVLYWGDAFRLASLPLVWIGNTLLLSSFISFLALNFTGSTPYTSFSGTLKETLTSVPVQLILAGLGIALLLVSSFLRFQGGLPI